MSNPIRPMPEADDATELAAMQAAAAESDADPRVIPHDNMRDWLLQ